MHYFCVLSSEFLCSQTLSPSVPLVLFYLRPFCLQILFYYPSPAVNHPSIFVLADIHVLFLVLSRNTGQDKAKRRPFLPLQGFFFIEPTFVSRLDKYIEPTLYSLPMNTANPNYHQLKPHNLLTKTLREFIK